MNNKKAKAMRKIGNMLAILGASKYLPEGRYAPLDTIPYQVYYEDKDGCVRLSPACVKAFHKRSKARAR